MFSLLISLLLFFIVTVQSVNAQLVEESTPSAQIIEITPTPTDIASTLTEIILTPIEQPTIT
jgi:hypothetical protein